MTTQKLRPSYTFTQDRLAALQLVIPEAFSDGKINWDVLKEALGTSLEEEGPDAEHFGLFWPGKRAARQLAALPSKGTLKPAAGEGINEGTTGNIFIEGDNLEVLKLLQKSYAGRIKMIYIDPPYNTGNDFVYKDDFREPLEDYLRKTGQMDEGGKMLTTNTRADGRFHSNWLNMMYPRLRLARQLLRDDGIIFASIDDHEVHNLRMIMNEIFGEENFLGMLARKTKSGGGSAAHHFAIEHDYVVAYAKNAAKLGPLFVKHDAEYLKRYSEQDNKGKYFWDTFERSYTQTKPYEIEAPDGTMLRGSWFRSKERFAEDLAAGEMRFLKNKSRSWSVQFKQRLAEGMKLRSLLTDNRFKSSQDDLQELEMKDIFSFPKPTGLIKVLAEACTKQNDIVLDFFAGSCTTAQAVLELNREDNGNRRFIMVQLPEPTNNPRFPTIAEIGKERIRRVITKIQHEDESKLNLSTRNKPLDKGFKVFKLGRSNYKAWQDYQGEDIQELETLFDGIETPLIEGWSREDLLTEILLMQGFPLDSSVIEQDAFTHNSILFADSDACTHRLFVCLDDNIADDTLEQLHLRSEDVFICLDSALTDQVKMHLADACNLNII